MAVFVKISDGHELRKMRITSKAMWFKTLKQQVARLFPSLGEDAEFELRYYDNDGDIISLSSTEELSTALAGLAEDAIWKLEIVRPGQTAPARPDPDPRGTAIDAGNYSRPWWNRPKVCMCGFGAGPEGGVDPFWSPRSLRPLHDIVGDSFGRRWEDRERNFDKEMDQQMDRMHRMHDDHMRQFKERRQRAEEEMQRILRQQREQERPVQQETSQLQEGAGSNREVAGGSQLQWHCQTFGSWEPVTLESPHGSRTVVGPVGYHMYWGYSDPVAPKEQEESVQQTAAAEHKREF